MSGLVGWLGLNPDANPRDAIESMVSGSNGEEGRRAKIGTGPDWAIAAYGRSSDASFHGSGIAAAVCGTPRVTDSKLAQLVQDVGAPQAFADAFRNSGSAFLSQLRGAFGIAISLHDERRLLLAVDRMATQDLYFAPVNTGVIFASSLPGLVRGPELTPKVDIQSIFNYLYFHVIPGPATIYEKVFRVQPGECVEFSEGNFSGSLYWAMNFTREKERASVAALKDEFRSLLETSVRNEMTEAGSIGCFLSGGTDSSTVAGMVGRVTGAPPETYSIGFAEQGYDEMEYARLASRHFGTRHHEYYVTPADVFDLVPRVANAFGQPFGNSSAVPGYYCAAMAKSDGIDKLLAGDGGDELFGGNERYSKQIVFSYYDNIPAALRTRLIEPALRCVPMGDQILPVRKARRYIEQAKMPMPDRLESYNHFVRMGYDEILEPEFLFAIDSEVPHSLLAERYHGAKAEMMLNKMLSLDLKFTLADNDLPKVSRMCELAGIEVGYPLLSDELVEFSARLPVDGKVRNLQLRYFFKEALRGFLPDEIIKKKKHGFGLPIGNWLVSDSRLNGLCLELLDGFKQRGIVRGAFIDRLTRQLVDEPGYYGTLAWLFMILEYWLQDQKQIDIALGN